MTFKEIVKKSNFTQKSLANEIGKSQKLVSNWCNGYCEPQISEILKLEQILAVDIHELLESFKK